MPHADQSQIKFQLYVNFKDFLKQIYNIHVTPLIKEVIVNARSPLHFILCISNKFADGILNYSKLLFIISKRHSLASRIHIYTKLPKRVTR